MADEKPRITSIDRPSVEEMLPPGPPEHGFIVQRPAEGGVPLPPIYRYQQAEKVTARARPNWFQIFVVSSLIVLIALNALNLFYFSSIHNDLHETKISTALSDVLQSITIIEENVVELGHNQSVSVLFPNITCLESLGITRGDIEVVVSVYRVLNLTGEKSALEEIYSNPVDPFTQTCYSFSIPTQSLAVGTYVTRVIVLSDGIRKMHDELWRVVGGN